MSEPHVTLLVSDYWLVKWNWHQWIQWRRGTYPTPDCGFGDVDERHFAKAVEAVSRREP